MWFMDALTVVILSVLLHTVSTFAVMYLFYSRWILPYLTSITQSVPESVKGFVEPYLDSKIVEIYGKMDDITASVKASTARFQRTVNQAVGYVSDMDDVDLESEEDIQTVKNRLSNRYGVDVAMQAIGKILADVADKKTADKASKETVKW